MAVHVVFRPMAEEDLDWVSQTEQGIYAFPWSRTNFADSLSAGYSSWIMLVDGQAVGYAVLMLVMDEAHLLNISIKPALQGRGLGTLLLEHVCAVASRAGGVQMFLEVRASNEAGLRLYDKWSFVRIGQRKDYYPAVNGREDAIVMRREMGRQE
ncbi:ribosomal protein S18-alanine N-acetyltransferase [Uliginosibacterium silvisoli]|uniref:ribosomal protein S18-alanine N-acetyltransferase n=1 Tax=Uliginosibacterium silvisoli TaxID=3114758 RepID=UPI003A7F374B